MKNIINLFLNVTLLALLVTSCKKVENKIYYEGGKAPVLTSTDISAPLTLLKANENNHALTLYWTNPEYKFTTGVSSQDVKYTLQVDTSGKHFEESYIDLLSVSSDLSSVFTEGKLNTLLLGSNFTENISYAIEIRIKSSINGSSPALYSNILKATVTPYLDVVYPVPADLFITGGATPGNWMGSGDAPLLSQKLTKVSSSKFVLSSIALNGGGSYLFVPAYGNWNNKYGGLGANNTNNASGDSFKPEGGDLKAPSNSGNYQIEVDFKTGKFSVKPI